MLKVLYSKLLFKILYSPQKNVALNLSIYQSTFDLLKRFRLLLGHCVKIVQITSFSQSVLFCIWSEYGNLRNKSSFSFRIKENADQKKLHKVTIKIANFFVLIVSCLCTHQRKNFTLNNWAGPEKMYLGTFQTVGTLLSVLSGINT